MNQCLVIGFAILMTVYPLSLSYSENGISKSEELLHPPKIMFMDDGGSDLSLTERSYDLVTDVPTVIYQQNAEIAVLFEILRFCSSF